VCPYYLGHLYYNTSEEELAFRHIQVWQEYVETRNKLIGFIIAILMIIFGFALPAIVNGIEPEEALALVKNAPVYDVNNDGQINCIDCSVCVWRQYPESFDLLWIYRYNNKLTNHVTLVLKPSGRIIEPQNRINLSFREYWGCVPSQGRIISDCWDERTKRFDMYKSNQKPFVWIKE